MVAFTAESRALLSIIQNVLGNGTPDLPDADWQTVEKSADLQGVLSLLYWGGKANQTQIPPERLRLWRDYMISTLMRNDDINGVQQRLLAWLQEQGIRAAILKGVSCSMYYPAPEARALGDIDILIDKVNLDKVDAYMTEQGFSVKGVDHPYHRGYYRNGIAVEMHVEISDFPNSKGGSIAREMARDCLREAQIAHMNDLSFPVLSDSHQALMLLTHMERHMVNDGVGLRQLCDWAAFVNAAASEHWEKKTLDLLEKCGLLTYAKAVTKTCVNYLGLPSDKAKWCLDSNDSLSIMLIEDILRAGSMGAAEEEHMTNLFFDRMQVGKSGPNRFKGLFMQINKLAYKRVPITRRYKVLLPICWVYLPLRYLVRSWMGKRPQKSVKKLIAASAPRQKLYSELQLYKTKN